MARERARTDRSGDQFSLVVFSPANPALDSEMHSHLARILRRRLRATDEAGWLDKRRIGVVLPGTRPHGAWKVADDVCMQFPAASRPRIEVYVYPTDPADLDRSIPADRKKEEGERPTRGLELLFAKGMPAWKRTIDVLGSATGLVLLAPLFVVIAVAIKLTSPGPVFFSQWRRGRGGRPFRMHKFRSMNVAAEAQKQSLLELNEQDGPAFKIKNDPRVTALGRFLRTTSIDELPQLWNVLKGEMSLVGPRPLPCDEADACLTWQRRRLDVTPGLTCIWQVQGRSEVTFNEWVRMDLQYVEQRSFWKDTAILVATVPAVILRRGAR